MAKALRWLWLTVGAFISTNAYAQSSTIDPTLAEAERRYNIAADAMKKGNYGEACTQFDGLRKLVPNNLTTAITTAQCYERWGHFVTARDKYEQALKVAANQANQDINKLNLITEGLASATRRISYIIVYVPGAVGSINGVSVTLDRVVLDRSDWGGTYTPLNQGKHEVRATAPGRKEWRQEINIVGEGEKFEISINRMEVDPKPPEQKEKTEPPRPQPPPMPATSTPPKEFEKLAAAKSPAPVLTSPKLDPHLIHPERKIQPKEPNTKNASSVEGGIALVLLGGGFIAGGSLLAREAISRSETGEKYIVYAGFSGLGFLTGAVGLISGLAIATASPAKPENRAPLKQPTPTATLRVGPGQISVVGSW